MTKDREGTKPIFQTWLQAYNNRLVQVAQGGLTAKGSGPAGPSDQKAPENEPPVEPNP